MQKPTFWGWLGAVIILLILGNIVFSLFYGKRLIEAQKELLQNQLNNQNNEG